MITSHCLTPPVDRSISGRRDEQGEEIPEGGINCEKGGGDTHRREWDDNFPRRDNRSSSVHRYLPRSGMSETARKHPLYNRSKTVSTVSNIHCKGRYTRIFLPSDIHSNRISIHEDKRKMDKRLSRFEELKGERLRWNKRTRIPSQLGRGPKEDPRVPIISFPVEGSTHQH